MATIRRHCPSTTIRTPVNVARVSSRLTDLETLLTTDDIASAGSETVLPTDTSGNFGKSAAFRVLSVNDEF